MIELKHTKLFIWEVRRPDEVRLEIVGGSPISVIHKGWSMQFHTPWTASRFRNRMQQVEAVERLPRPVTVPEPFEVSGPAMHSLDRYPPRKHRRR